MKLAMPNNHPVVCIDGDHYIVDTGAPVSFHYASPRALDRSGQFDGILGVTALTDRRIVFDFEKKILSVKL